MLMKEKKLYKRPLIMNIATLVIMLAMGVILYMTWFQLQLVDKNSAEDARHLSNAIANQRECLKRQDTDCPVGKYVEF